MFPMEDYLTTDGVIEDAVFLMMDTRKKAIANGLPLNDEWSVRVVMSDDLGYEIFVKEQIFSKYVDKKATEPMIIKSLVTFIFELIEEDLCEIQTNSTIAC